MAAPVPAYTSDHEKIQAGTPFDTGSGHDWISPFFFFFFLWWEFTPNSKIGLVV
jgi:hypothetical protein